MHIKKKTETIIYDRINKFTLLISHFTTIWYI
jgi:hypothetical protein